MFWSWLASFLTGPLLGKALDAYKAKLAAGSYIRRCRRRPRCEGNSHSPARNELNVVPDCRDRALVRAGQADGIMKTAGGCRVSRYRRYSRAEVISPICRTCTIAIEVRWIVRPVRLAGLSFRRCPEACLGGCPGHLQSRAGSWRCGSPRAPVPLGRSRPGIPEPFRHWPSPSLTLLPLCCDARRACSPSVRSVSGCRLSNAPSGPGRSPLKVLRHLD
jgi:hypothetical protein